MSVQTQLPIPPEIDYPESDGLPMADNTRQWNYMVTIKEGLECQFRDEVDVFVAGNLYWYPVEGDNTLRAAPDILVAFGRPKGDRGSYMQWREDNIAPQVTWEILSPSNTPAIMQARFDFFERYGVQEYYLYDPDGGELRGWLRRGKRLVEIKNITDGWTSPLLGVRLTLKDGDLIVTGRDGRPFPTVVQLGRERDAAEALAQVEKRERERAQQQAEQERRERERAQQRAEQEKREREAAQQRAERLAAQLRNLGVEPEPPKS